MTSSFVRPAAVFLCLALTSAISAAAGADGPAYLVKELNSHPSPSSSYPKAFVSMGPYVFFTQSYSGWGNTIYDNSALWRTDGTDAGTIRLRTGAGGGVVWNGRLWFQTTKRDEIGVTDGTLEGTSVIQLPAPIDWIGGPIAGPDGLYYLSGSKLWRTRGTQGDVTLVSNSAPMYLTGSYDTTAILGQTLYFIGTTSVNRVDQASLWRTDASGTTILCNPPGAARIDSITVVGSLLYFYVVMRDAYGYGKTDLWRSDGTPQGTYKLKTTALYGAYPDGTIGSTLYFSVSESSSTTLWKTDGTVAGTVPANLPAVEAIGNLADGRALLLAASGGSTTLLAFDGATTTELATNFTGGDRMVNAGSQAFFFNSGPLWRSDGTARGTINLGPVGASYESIITAVLGSTIFFSGSEEWHGAEPWKSDGTLDGTVMVKDVVATSYGSAPDHLTPLRGGALFTATTDYVGTYPYQGTPGLWFSDGTADGTHLVLPGADFYEPLPFACGGLAYFSHTTDEEGDELWVSDGTASGTHLVKDIYPGSSGTYVNSSYPRYFTCLDNRLLFVARSISSSSQELWRTDGTAEGTFMVRDGLSDAGYSTNSLLIDEAPVVAGHTAYFARNVQLWRTDGTPGGTYLVTDVPGGISQMKAAGKLVYFHAQSPLDSDVSVLWCSDGTEAGTRALLAGYYISLQTAFYEKMIVSLRTSEYAGDGAYAVDDASATRFDSSLSYDASFAALNGRFYYNTYNAPALRTTDGVTSFVTGVGDLDRILATAGGRLYARGKYGSPLLETDGTPSGTTTIFSRGASEAAASGGRLYIAADELYAYDLPVAVTSFEPAAVPPSGGNVTVTGRGFSSPATVMIGGSAATVTSVTPTTISFTAPPNGAGSYSIDLTLGDGRMMSADTPLEYACTGPTAVVDPVASGYFPFASVSLHGSGGVRCAWFPPIGLDDASSCTPHASISTATTYNLIVFNEEGCQSSNHASVRIYISSLTAPAALRATVDSPAHVSVTWNPVAGATGYEVARASAGSPLAVIATVQTSGYSETVQAGTYVYRVRAVATGAPSPYSNGDVASTVAFTDDPLVPQETVVRAKHLTELRQTVDELISIAGAGMTAWSGVNAGVSPIRASDITELRSALSDALALLGAPQPSYSRAIGSGDSVRASDLQEIRNALR